MNKFMLKTPEGMRDLLFGEGDLHNRNKAELSALWRANASVSSACETLGKMATTAKVKPTTNRFVLGMMSSPAESEVGSRAGTRKSACFAGRSQRVAQW